MFCFCRKVKFLVTNLLLNSKIRFCNEKHPIQFLKSVLRIINQSHEDSSYMFTLNNDFCFEKHHRQNQKNILRDFQCTFTVFCFAMLCAKFSLFAFLCS
eukprot:UN02642